MPDPYVVRIYPSMGPAYQVTTPTRGTALTTARKHLLDAARVTITNPVGSVIYRHAKPTMKHKLKVFAK